MVLSGILIVEHSRSLEEWNGTPILDEVLQDLETAKKVHDISVADIKEWSVAEQVEFCKTNSSILKNEPCMAQCYVCSFCNDLDLVRP